MPSEQRGGKQPLLCIQLFTLKWLLLLGKEIVKLLRIGRGLGGGSAFSESVMFINCEEKKLGTVFCVNSCSVGIIKALFWSFLDKCFLKFFLNLHTRTHIYVYSQYVYTYLEGKQGSSQEKTKDSSAWKREYYQEE